MDAGVAHVASAVAMLVHPTLVPAGRCAVAALVVRACRRRRRPGARARRSPGGQLGSGRTSWRLAAVCTTASAVAHAMAIPQHATESLAFGMFSGSPA